MAIVTLCTGTAAAAALLESLIIGKLGAVVYGYTLEYFIKVCAELKNADRMLDKKLTVVTSTHILWEDPFSEYIRCNP